MNGFLIGVVISEKIPCRMSAVGTTANGLETASALTPSYAPMKKVLLWPSYSFGMTTGPSAWNPN